MKKMDFILSLSSLFPSVFFHLLFLFVIFSFSFLYFFPFFFLFKNEGELFSPNTRVSAPSKPSPTVAARPRVPPSPPLAHRAHTTTLDRAQQRERVKHLRSDLEGLDVNQKSTFTFPKEFAQVHVQAGSDVR